MPFTLRNVKADLEDIGSRFDGAPDLEFRAATKALALQQAGVFERREQLRDRGRRDGRAAGELGADHLTLTDGLEGEVLGDGQRRLVRGQQPLDPAADQRRRPHESLRSLAAVVVVTRARH